MSSTEPTSTSPDRRNRRQAGLFFGGLAFVVASTLFTRRSIARRYRTLTPRPLTAGAPPSSAATGYTPAAAAAAEPAAPTAKDALQNNGPLLALEALTVATVNVLSWAMMLAGGALWAADISTLPELRRRLRGGLGFDGSGRSEQEAEEEIEEWIAGVLARKEDKAAAAAPREHRNERGKPR